MAWCHECEKEYKEDIENCPDCSGELFEELPPALMEPAKLEWNFSSPFKKKSKSNAPAWPKNINGEEEKPVFLKKIVGTQMDYELTVGMLEAYGFPVMKNMSALGRLGKIVLGFSGTGMDIYVPESMYHDAKMLLDDCDEKQESEVD